MDDALKTAGPYVLALIVLIYNSKILGTTREAHKEQKKHRAHEVSCLNINIAYKNLIEKITLESRMAEHVNETCRQMNANSKEVRVIQREGGTRPLTPEQNRQISFLQEGLRRQTERSSVEMEELTGCSERMLQAKTVYESLLEKFDLEV